VCRGRRFAAKGYMARPVRSERCYQRLLDSRPDRAGIRIAPITGSGKSVTATADAPHFRIEFAVVVKRRRCALISAISAQQHAWSVIDFVGRGLSYRRARGTLALIGPKRGDIILPTRWNAPSAPPDAVRSAETPPGAARCRGAHHDSVVAHPDRKIAAFRWFPRDSSSTPGLRQTFHTILDSSSALAAS